MDVIDLKEALDMVLELASDNALDPEDPDTIANGLTEHADYQQACIQIVFDFANTQQ